MKAIMAIVITLCALLGSCTIQETAFIDEPGVIMIDEPEDDTWQDSVTMTFDSFDGGGPEYSIIIEDPEIVSYKRVTEYNNPDYEMIDGAGYDVTFVFTGQKPGTTTMTISARSPIGDNYDIVYTVTVNEALEISVKENAVYGQ